MMKTVKHKGINTSARIVEEHLIFFFYMSVAKRSKFLVKTRRKNPMQRMEEWETNVLIFSIQETLPSLGCKVALGLVGKADN